MRVSPVADDDFEALRRVLDIAWQPIADLQHGTLYAYEALIRGPSGSDWEFPGRLFPKFEAAGWGERLEMAGRHMALGKAVDVLPSEVLLFMNLNPYYPPFALPLPKAFSEHPERLAIEISESHPILDNRALIEAIHRWRATGHLIVLDDYGSGYATESLVLALRPEVIKLDISLVHGIDRDQTRQSVVSSVRDFTLDMGIAVVAEGVETQDEMTVLRQLGVDYAQGFWLAEPQLARKDTALMCRTLPPARRALHLPAQDVSSDETLKFYESAVKDSGVPSFLVDRHRRILAWNEAAASVTGYRAEHLLRLPCFHAPLHHRAGQHVLCFGACPLVESMATRSAVGPQTAYMTLENGSEALMHLSVMPIWDQVKHRVIGAIQQFHPIGDDVEHAVTGH